MSLDGKVIIVTGAGSGIGRGTAKLLASEGVKVVIAEINETNGSAASHEIVSSGGTARFIHTNVADEESVGAMVEETMTSFGSIYGLVNNAGIEMEAELTSMPAADWDKIIELDPTDTVAFFNRGLLFVEKGDYDRGIAERPLPKDQALPCSFGVLR